MSEDKNALTKQIRENLELASNQMKQNIEMTAAMTRYLNLMGGTLNTTVNAAY